MLTSTINRETECNTVWKVGLSRYYPSMIDPEHLLLATIQTWATAVESSVRLRARCRVIKWWRSFTTLPLRLAEILPLRPWVCLQKSHVTVGARSMCQNGRLPRWSLHWGCLRGQRNACHHGQSEDQRRSLCAVAWSRYSFPFPSHARLFHLFCA